MNAIAPKPKRVVRTELPSLTPKQQRFVAEYLKDLNATQAAIRAGYSGKTAQQIGSRLLSNVVVAVAVEAGQAKVAEKLDLSAEKVLRDLAEVQAKAIADGQYGSAVRAIELRGKHIGMFEDKLNVRFRNDPSTLGDDELAAIVAGERGGGTAKAPGDKGELH